MKAKATGFELPLSYQQILSWVLLNVVDFLVLRFYYTGKAHWNCGGNEVLCYSRVLL